MTRLVAITAFAASLLLWSVPAYSDSPQEFSDEMMMAMMEYPSCRSTTCGNPQCRSCRAGRHAIGLPLPHIGLLCPMDQGLPAGYSFTQRLSGAAPRQRPVPMATIPMPVGPPPSGFAGVFFTPQQYQQVQPMIGGYGYPQVPVPAQGYDSAQGTAQGYGSAQGHAQGYGSAQGTAQGYGSAQGHAQGHAPVPDQRIVYVPYAAPPPIHVERLGKALAFPMLRPPVMRRLLGDANMYEYPEMPQRLYTTRGPRDFLAPNPPGIGY